MEKVRLVMKTNFSTKFHFIGFWIIVSLLVGMIAGNFYSERLISKRLSDSVTYKAIKIDGREYDLMAMSAYQVGIGFGAKVNVVMAFRLREVEERVRAA